MGKKNYPSNTFIEMKVRRTMYFDEGCRLPAGKWASAAFYIIFSFTS